MATIRTHFPPQPFCVLDASRTPAVFRCKHCRTERAVQFPLDLGQMKGSIDAFLEEHGLCHVPLVKLRAAVEELGWRVPKTRAAAVRQRGTVVRMQAAIRMREGLNRKKRG